MMLRDVRFVVGVTLAVVAMPNALSADVLHLRSGSEMEVEVLEDLGESLRVRTSFGVVDIKKEEIVKHVKGTPSWVRYEKKRAAMPDTADAHYRLARWCERHGLRDKWRVHLERVIELEPDHADARAALGYVREDGKWLIPPSDRAPTPEEIAARRAEREEERLLRKLVSGWFVKIKSIYRGRLEGEQHGSEKFEDGRRQILEIRDPLALPALAGVLSTGHKAVRALLVEALAQFEEDESTMNLVVVSLLDPDREIRHLAARELARRSDDRVAARLRQALGSEEEYVLRNAAESLGILRDRAAVPDLVAVLETTSRQRVVVSQPVFIDDVFNTFRRPSIGGAGGHRLRYQPTSIGVLGENSWIGTRHHVEIQDVSVYRT